MCNVPAKNHVSLFYNFQEYNFNEKDVNVPVCVCVCVCVDVFSSINHLKRLNHCKY